MKHIFVNSQKCKYVVIYLKENVRINIVKEYILTLLNNWLLVVTLTHFRSMFYFYTP